MSSLVDSHKDPNPVVSPVDHKKVVDEGTKAQRKITEDRFRQWQAYINTDEGKKASALADPMIEHCDYIQNKSLTDFVGEFGYVPSLEQVNDIKAEARGVRKVWMLIKTEPDSLKRMLDEIEGFDPEESKKSGWQKVTDPIRKKLTD